MASLVSNPNPRSPRPMRPPRPISYFLSPWAIAFGFSLTAINPTTAGEPGSVQLAVRVEYYELDTAALHALVAAPTSGTDATGLRGEVLARVALGEARLVESSYVVTRSGQRAKVESITEWIYGVGFDPPEVSKELTGRSPPESTSSPR